VRVNSLVGFLLVAGCEGTSLDLERMIHQKRFRQYERCDYFPDGRAMRTPPAATRPHDRPLGPSAPPKPTLALLQHGRRRFEIYCGACHGLRGDGDSEVATNMDLQRPPSLLKESVRQRKDQKIYQIISEGYGLMPSYADVLTDEERWAVIFYVRALERTQPNRLSELPLAIRSAAQRGLE
jgi:mono/diheme cytochrome c family protein